MVTKFHPAEDVRRLAALGVTDVGENRDQEAAEKAAALGGLQLRWHFIGQLQSNKAKSVVKYAHAVHSVDRPQLAAALAKAMAAEQERTGRAPLDCFIQVSLDDDAGGHRGGALPADVPALADQLAAAEGLRLAGVMAVAPFGADPVPAFEKLAGHFRTAGRRPSRRHGHFRGHEPGPGTGRPVRGDTPAHWLRYSRFASGVAVGSTYWK